MKYTIAIDFDGVIHASRHGWKDGSIYDDPMPGAKEAIVYLNSIGFRVMCFTARNVEEAQKWLMDRLQLSVMQIEVTNTKPPALVYIDDRGLRFTGDWKIALEQLKDLGVLDYRFGGPKNRE